MKIVSSLKKLGLVYSANPMFFCVDTFGLIPVNVFVSKRLTIGTEPNGFGFNNALKSKKTGLEVRLLIFALAFTHFS